MYSKGIAPNKKIINEIEPWVREIENWKKWKFKFLRSLNARAYTGGGLGTLRVKNIKQKSSKIIYFAVH